MNAVERALRDFLAARPEDVAVALVGGLAVSARTEPRFTRDLDFAIAVVSDDEAAHYVFRLRQVGYEIVTALEQTTRHRLSTINRIWWSWRASRMTRSGSAPRLRSSSSCSAGSHADAICGSASPRSARSQIADRELHTAGQLC